MDSSGEQHLQMDHNIHKRRLDLNGVPIEESKIEEMTMSSTVSLFFFILIKSQSRLIFKSIYLTPSNYVGRGYLVLRYSLSAPRPQQPQL